MEGGYNNDLTHNIEEIFRINYLIRIFKMSMDFLEPMLK